MQQQINLPIATVAGYTFQVPLIVGIDWEDYDTAEDREITLQLIGPHTHTFVGERADEFKSWFEQVTGKARIEQVGSIVPGAFRRE